jgi:hypothetical protein
MKVRTNQILKSEVEAAVTGEVLRVGPSGFAKDDVVRRFLNQGTSRSTLYTWVDKALASGKPGQVLTQAVKAAAEERAGRTSDPVSEVVAEVAAHLPVAVRPDQMVGMPTVNLIARLGEIVANMDLLIAHSKDKKTGKVRNARLMLAASDRLRACLETAMKVYAAMRDVDQIDQLHAAVLEEIAKESPQVAERILRRIDIIAAKWVG